VDTNHDMSRCLRQSPQQVPDKVADLSPTQIMKVGDVICVADFYDLCPRKVHNFVGNLLRTLSQSPRNGIWLHHIGGFGVGPSDLPSSDRRGVGI